MGVSGKRMFISVDTTTMMSGCNVRVAAWEVRYRSNSPCTVSLQVWKVVDATAKRYKLVGQNKHTLPKSTIEYVARVDIKNVTQQILIQEPVVLGITTFSSDCRIDDFGSLPGKMLYEYKSSTTQLTKNVGQEVVLNYVENFRKANLRAILQGMFVKKKKHCVCIRTTIVCMFLFEINAKAIALLCVKCA